MTYSNSMSDLAEGMGKYCQKQLALCDNLESIADSLPNEVDIQHCLYVARALYPAVKSAHEFEEGQLFPALAAHIKKDASLDASLERLRYEHWEDEAYCQELTEELMDLAQGKTKRDSEKTGYMLRGFFEGLRRHIAFENEYIYPMIRSLASNEN